MIQFLESVFGRLKLSAKLYDGSAYSYRRQWDSIMQKLEIPFSQSQKGVTPGVLRGSGATHMYLCTEDISRIAWRGRWTKLKTVEFYLQEVAAQLLLHRLSTSARRRIEIFAKYSVDLLLWFCALPCGAQGLQRRNRLHSLFLETNCLECLIDHCSVNQQQNLAVVGHLTAAGRISLARGKVNCFDVSYQFRSSAGALSGSKLSQGPTPVFCFPPD